MKVEKVSMRSPYCASEMILGYIYSGKNDICWTPDNEKIVGLLIIQINSRLF